MSIRVLMLNRSDAYSIHGGDTIQMEETAKGLRNLGVDVEVELVCRLSEIDTRFDVVHIFNIQTAGESWEALLWAKAQKLPVVLSSIYWSPFPHWYRNANEKKPAWKLVNTLLGPTLGSKTFEAWQNFRSPANEFWKLQRRLLLSVDKILPNSSMEAKQLLHDFRLGKHIYQEISVIPNAIDDQLYIPKPQPNVEFQRRFDGQNLILAVGRISPEKNCLALIEALWDVDVQIAFIGSSAPHSKDYVDLCHQRAAERKGVHFIDWMDHKDLPGIYASANVHILPSWRETPGLANLEAAAAGCKIVSTSIGSAYEYFGDKAWYCDPANTKTIKQAVLSALNSRPSEDLRSHILKNFTWNAAAKATLTAYQSVLNI